MKRKERDDDEYGGDRKGKRRQTDEDGGVKDRLNRIEARLEKIEGLLMGLSDLTDAVRVAVISLEQSLDTEDEEDDRKGGDGDGDENGGNDGVSDGDVPME